MKIDPSFTLHTKRCQLRHVQPEDIIHSFSASRVKGFTDGMQWEPPETEEELQEPYHNSVAAWADGSAYSFTIVDRATLAFIGRISIRKQASDKEWDLGFWTHPDMQGQGYMTEAAKEVIKFGFSTLQADTICACHAVWNTASEKVLTRCGLRFKKHVPKGFLKRGQWVEENLLAITKAEYFQHSM